MYIPRRLIKFVRDGTSLSIVEIHAAWAAGRVVLHPAGEAPEGPVSLDTLVFAEDRVLLDGAVLQPKTHHFTAILNKPRSVLSTTRDPRGKGDLQPWLRQMPSGTFPVGRLDRDTTGLLLFSTDGDLSNAVLRPEHHTEKLYWLWLNETFAPDDARLSALTEKNDPRYDGAQRAEILHRTEHYVEILLTLDQGKHRQIRRMCRALNLRLLQLHRKQIGPLSDQALSIGEFRTLEHAEVEALWKATGGRALLNQSKLRALREMAARLRAEGSPNAKLESWLNERAEAGLPEPLRLRVGGADHR